MIASRRLHQTGLLSLCFLVLLAFVGCPTVNTVYVPDVTGESQTVAESLLQLEGLSTGTVTQQYSSSVDTGRVISQNPTGGTLSTQGASVDLVLSQGPEPVPSSWTKLLGGADDDWPASVEATTDGGCIIAGFTRGDALNAPFRITLRKLDARGTLTWSREFGGYGDDYAAGVVQTSDGGYACVANSMSYGNGNLDILLFRVDKQGTSLWGLVYDAGGQDEATAIRETSDGGFIIAGTTNGKGAGGADFYAIKTDPWGNIQWDATYGGAGTDASFDVQETSDGGYLLVGATDSSGAGLYDAYAVKTNADGGQVWARTFGGASNEEFQSVTETSDGAYAAAGKTQSFGAGHWDAYLVKFDASGNETWAKTFGGTSADDAEVVQQTSDSGFFLAGEKTLVNGGNVTQMSLIKTDSAGNQEFESLFGGDNAYEGAVSADQTADNGYIMVGPTDSFNAANLDIYVVKTDASGNGSSTPTL